MTVRRSVLIYAFGLGLIAAGIAVYLDLSRRAGPRTPDMPPPEVGYREVTEELGKCRSAEALDRCIQKTIESNSPDAFAAVVRFSVTPLPPDLARVVNLRIGLLTEEQVLTASDSVLDREGDLKRDEQRMLANRIAAAAIADDEELVRSLYERIGLSAEDAERHLGRIRTIDSGARAFRELYRLDPRTRIGAEKLSRIVWDPESDEGIRHQAMQKIILSPPGPHTSPLHERILAGEHRGEGAVPGPDAYQVTLMETHPDQYETLQVGGGNGPNDAKGE